MSNASPRFVREVAQLTPEPFQIPGYTSLLDNSIANRALFREEVQWLNKMPKGFVSLDPRITREW